MPGFSSWRLRAVLTFSAAGPLALDLFDARRRYGLRVFMKGLFHKLYGRPSCKLRHWIAGV